MSFCFTKIIIIFFVRKIQEMGKAWVDQGTQISHEFKHYKFDTPNTHAFIELLLRGLPSTLSVRWLSCSPFEAKHQLAKLFGQRVKSSSLMKQQLAIMEKLNTVLSTAFVLQGGRWGNQLEFQGGNLLRNFCDEKGRTHLLVNMYTGKHGVLNQDSTDENETEWYTQNYIWKKVEGFTNNKVESGNLTLEQKIALSSQIKQFFDVDVDLNVAKVVSIKSITNGAQHLKKGDSVQVLYSDKVEYGKITHLVEINDTYQFCFLDWYEKEKPKKGNESEVLHKVVRFPIIKPWIGNLYPIPISLILEQVVIYTLDDGATVLLTSDYGV